MLFSASFTDPGIVVRDDSGGEKGTQIHIHEGLSQIHIGLTQDSAIELMRMLGEAIYGASFGPVGPQED